MNLQTIKTYYGNGRLSQEYTVDDQGRKHGTYCDWWKNGQLWEQSEFVNDKLHGIRYVWDNDGSVMYIMQYDNDKKLVEVDYTINPIMIRMIDPNIESSKFIVNITSSLDCEGRKYEFAND